MRTILTLLTAVAAALVYLFWFYETTVTAPVGTSVVGERPTDRSGNQLAVVLPKTISQKQQHLMMLTHQVATAAGFKEPEVMQAILLQETQAGALKSYRVANPGPEAYFGPMQVKLAAAHDVLKRWPELYAKFDFHTRTDDEIKANLILNDRFNIEVATRYVLILKTSYGFKGRELLNAYNRGPGGVKLVADDYHYGLGAQEKLASYRARGR